MIDGRSYSHEILETYRFAAIKLNKSGVTVNTIANSFNVTTRAVYSWLKKYKTRGAKSLRSSKASGPAANLSAEQLSILCKLIRKPATKLGYSTDLWSGPRIRHLIKNEFGIEYHFKHMPRLLKWLGLELKFPERRALEQDPKAIKKWKQKRLPEIFEFSRKKGALIFYADESIISLTRVLSFYMAISNFTADNFNGSIA